MLICDLLNEKNIKNYKVDGLIINSYEYSCFNDKTFKKDELEDIITLIKNNNQKVLLSSERIIEEFELDDYYKYLDYILTLPIDYLIYSDLCTLNYLKDKTFSFKLIYDSKTMITNKYDSLYYKNKNIYTMISNELSLNDMIKISEMNNSILEVYGYHQIFYSRRTIFDSYAKYKNIDNNFCDKLMHVKEEFREELYPIYQSRFGTYVYTSKRFMILKELPKLSNIIIYKINSSFIEENELFSIIDVYLKAFSSQDNNLNNLEKELMEINSNVNKSFLYNKSILLKEDE